MAISIKLVQENPETLSQIHQARTSNQGSIARHFCSSMSSTAKKMAVAAAAVFFAAGTAVLYTAVTHGAVVLGGIALIGFTGLTISTLGLYIAATAFLAASIYLCLRLMCATDNGYTNFLKDLATHVNIVNQAKFNCDMCIQKNDGIQQAIRQRENAEQRLIAFLNKNAPQHVRHDSLKRILDWVVKETGLRDEIHASYRTARKTPHEPPQKVKSNEPGFFDSMLGLFV